jgi:hypothetical protein
VQYANKHYRGSGYSVFASFEPGEDQQWCYAYGVLVWPGVALCRMVVYGSLSIVGRLCLT